MSESTTATATRNLSPEEAEHELHLLIGSLQSGILATAPAEGTPEPSYTPFVTDENGDFYVYVSRLAKHTSPLLNERPAGWMLIEDEASAANTFARKRATFQCQVQHLPRETPEFELRIKAFIERFGSTAETLAGMTDFHLFRLQPQQGRLVLGFGAAFRLQGLNVERHLRGQHKTGSRS